MEYFYPEMNRFAEVADRASLSYQTELKAFEKWLREREIAPIKLTRAMATEYRQYLKQCDLMPAQARSHISVANDFYSWWYGAPNLSPFRGMKITAPVRRSKSKNINSIRIHSDYQVLRLTNAVKKLHTDPYRFYRATLILNMALYMGLDQYEMCRLTVRDASSKDGFLLVDGREVPYAPQMRLLVRQYLAYRAAKVWGNTAELFLLPNGEACSPNSISKEIRDVSEQANIKTNLKTLNDTFAYNLAVDGAPAQVIMTMRKCTYNKAVIFIEMSVNGIDLVEVYEKSVTQRMRPVNRRARG